MSKKEALEIELQELEECIYPKYQEIVSNITVQKTDMIDSFKKLRCRFNWTYRKIAEEDRQHHEKTDII